MELKELAKQAGYAYERHNQNIYGMENGYYFSTELANQKGLIRIYLNVDRPEAVANFYDTVRNRYPALALGGIRGNGGYENFIDVNYYRFKDGHEFKYMLEALMKELHSSRLRQRCAHTGKISDLGLYAVGRSIKILSDEGFSQEAKVSQQVSKGLKENRVLGYVGMFAGLLIGLFLRGLVIRITGWNFGIMSYVVLLLVFKGFRFKGGEPRRSDMYIMIGITIIGVIFSNVIYVFFQTLILLGNYAWMILPQLFASVFEEPAEFLKSVLFDLIFLAIYGYQEVRHALNTAPITKRAKLKYKRLL